MELSISPYSQELPLPRYKKTSYDDTLVMGILAKKQGEYDQMVQRLNSLKSTSLNISMLNLKGKQRLDEYNKRLEEMTSGDIGDLTDAQVQSKVASYFTDVANDDDLKKRSRLSSFYNEQNTLIDNAQKSPDPTKSGYNKINEFVYKNWKGGLNDFILADNVDHFDQTKQRYTPFKDIDQKMVNVVKLLHEDEVTRQSPNGGPYDLLTTEKGVRAEKIKQAIQTQLDADEMAQFEIMSKYKLLSQSPDEIYNSYTQYIDANASEARTNLAKATALKEAYDPSKLDKGMDQDAYNKKVGEWTELQSYYAEQEKRLQGQLAKATSLNLSKSEWDKKGVDELLPFVNHQVIENYVDGMANALSWKQDIQKIGTNEPYFAQQKLNLMQAALEQKERYQNALLRLSEMKLGLEAKKGQAEYSEPQDIVPSPTEVSTTWQNTTAIQQQLAKNTNPIVESVPDANLLNPKWVEENGSNYDVQLWGYYKAMYPTEANQNGSANKAGFAAFRQQVLNGDHDNQPALSALSQAYKRDTDVTKWLSSKLDKASNIIEGSLHIADVRADGNGPSLGDYARSNGWNGQGSMTFGIKKGSSYEQKSWTELKTMYNIDPKSLNDPHLAKVVGAAIEKEKSGSKVVEDLFQNDMPNILQGKQVLSLNKKAVTDHIGEINASLKGTSNKANILLSNDDVEQIAVPQSLGTKGVFTLTKAGADKLKEIDGLIVIDSGGNKIKAGDIQPNIQYQFQTKAQVPYDALYNAMYESEGYLSRKIHGVDVTISKAPNNQMAVKIDGQTKIMSQKDVNLVLQEAENAIYRMKGKNTSTAINYHGNIPANTQ